MKTPRQRILIVEDHPLFRQGVIYLLSKALRDATFSEADDSAEALRLIKSKPWDAVLLDISLPDRSGIDLLADIKRLRPHLPVLILTMYPEEKYAVRVFKAGADGYLRKNAAPAEVIEALKTVMSGQKYVANSVGQRFAIELGSGKLRDPHETLSEREHQVFRFLVAGRGLTDIAAELNLNVATVSTYRHRILEKTNLTNNAELIRYAIEHNAME